MRRTRGDGLIESHLERISHETLDRHFRAIAEEIGTSHGLYALYLGERLYYVGIASDLKGRVRRHLADRHRRRWDRFSLYLVRRREHIRDLESLLIRIARPQGNRQRGTLQNAQSLRERIMKRARAAEEARLQAMFGDESPRIRPRRSAPARPVRRRRQVSSIHGRLSLAGLLDADRTPLRAEYKGQTYAAIALADGRIRFRGRFFDSPSGAGTAATGGPIDGWHFWKYRPAGGEWTPLDHLRNAPGR